jgi:hypothetical protein
MKTIFLGTIILFSILNFDANAQKKMSKVIAKEHQLLAAKCNREIEASTKTLRFIFTNRSEMSITIVKGRDFNSLILYGKLFWFNSSPGNLNLLLKNGETIRLNICDSTIIDEGGDAILNTIHTDKGKLLLQYNSVTARTFYCFYEITQNDLQKLTENIIERVHLFYNSQTTEYEDFHIMKLSGKFVMKASLDILGYK